MQNIMSLGTPPWTRSEMLECLDEFASIYADRPIKDNKGGMRAPHMFAVWFMAKRLDPDLIVESGIWKGQSTWLLENACPNAKLISIDLKLDHRAYISPRANYSDTDFAEQDWTEVTDRSLAFFDDHQNAYKRLQQCNWFGFKHIIFEDNYPASRGDCYSLKKAFSHAGFTPAHSRHKSSALAFPAKLLRKLAELAGISPDHLMPQHETVNIRPNAADSAMLQKRLEVYFEFPPVFRAGNTRWGDAWDEASYPTAEPLLETATQPTHRVFLDEAMFYTWICYARLK